MQPTAGRKRKKIPPEFNVKNQYVLNFDPFEFRIDILIVDASTGENLCVLDTKYKTALKPEDFNQVAVYASAIKTKNAFLVYPKPIPTSLHRPISDALVRSIIFDISKDPDEAGNEFLEELINYLGEVRESHMLS